MVKKIHPFFLRPYRQSGDAICLSFHITAISKVIASDIWQGKENYLSFASTVVSNVVKIFWNTLFTSSSVNVLSEALNTNA